MLLPGDMRILFRLLSGYLPMAEIRIDWARRPNRFIAYCRRSLYGVTKVFPPAMVDLRIYNLYYD